MEGRGPIAYGPCVQYAPQFLGERLCPPGCRHAARPQVTRWLSTCGNAVVEGMEQCDDGDQTDGDGCSASCTVEPGWSCAGSPSNCTSVVGALVA